MRPSDLISGLDRIVLGIVLAVGLAACEGAKPIAEATGFATTTAEPRQFVRESRASETAYIPIGRQFPVANACRGGPGQQPAAPAPSLGRFRAPPAVAQECRTLADFKAIEQNLESQRQANEASAGVARQLGATPPPAPAPVRP